MKLYCVFDDDGRCIGREARTDDQDIPGVAAWLEIPPEKWTETCEHHKYWRENGELKLRVKVPPPVVPRQRMSAQPVIAWEQSSEPATMDWKPRSIFNPGDVISDGYVCIRKGISGDERPALGGRSRIVFERMPWAEWERAFDTSALFHASERWRAKTIYMAGELILAGRVAYRCSASGVTGIREPDWIADRISDRDGIEIALADHKGKDVYLRIGNERIKQTGPLKLTSAESKRITIAIDSPGFYSDEVLISVETP